MTNKNHLIEKYMGVERPGPESSCSERSLFVEPNYQGSWDDLMQVVETIAAQPDVDVILSYKEAVIKVHENGSVLEIKATADTNFESVYNVVVGYLEYLEEYNLPFQP